MDSLIWETVCSQPHKCSETNFWEAVQLWNKCPNLINKRIFGANLLDLGSHLDLALFHKVLSEVQGKSDAFVSNYFINELKPVKESNAGEASDKEIVDYSRYRVLAKTILQKRGIALGFEVTLFDKENKSAVFVEPVARNVIYMLEYKDDVIIFKIPDCSSIDVNWYRDVLLPRITRWMSNYSGVHYSTLTLVPIDQYKILYSKLKSKYTADILKIWTEVTDPDKFIHEDIAIATYLLLLWKGKPPQRYADLGCGNGLLVHILNSESHLGIGYDLRARKIWSKYPASTILKVVKIKPSREQMFGQVDWIIGNHSDELTPWIPVIATYNSPQCNFFLLPCCAYNFDGSKFRRSDSSRSLYSDYLDYVEKICMTCGFNVNRDKLRIPSTKRVCFVSSGRYHGVDCFDQYKATIDSLIEESSNKVGDQTDNWKIKVKLRDSEEKVRNCTQIDNNLKLTIVELIAGMLQIGRTNLGLWYEGKPTPLEEIIRNLPSKILKELKNEGKGLQTFIKNHHHIFRLENGIVQFRKPTLSEVKTEHWKTKECWFHKNHPDSCPLQDDECSYRHSR